MANRNSPTSVRTSNLTTLGRNCEEYLKQAKFRTFERYKDQVMKDKAPVLSTPTEAQVFSGEESPHKFSGKRKFGRLTNGVVE